MASHVRKGDTVMINSGSHKGKVGTVMHVDVQNQRVTLKGINLRTKHLKPTRLSPQGGIITREAPIHISKVNPVVDGKPTRVRFEIRPDGSKVRIAVKGGKELGVVRGPEAKKHVGAGKSAPRAAALAAGRKKVSKKASTKSK